MTSPSVCLQAPWDLARSLWEAPAEAWRLRNASSPGPNTSPDTGQVEAEEPRGAGALTHLLHPLSPS